MMIEQQERDGGHDAAIDLHCPSGGDDDNNSVNSAMTQDSKSHPPNLKAGATKHGKEKKHSSSSKKKVASTHSIKSHSTGKQRSADTHHSAEHVDVEQGGVGGASAQVKASDAHQRSAGSHPSLHPPLKGKGAPANLSVGIAVDPRSGSPALDQHLEFSDEMSDKVSSSSRASLNKDVLPSDSTAASAAGVSPSPRATHVDVAAKLDQGSLPSFPAAVELGDHMPITHTGSAAGSAAEDVVGMAAVRRLSQSELEEKMQSVVEQEVRRRVKLALTAAATKDYTGFANAIGSKSPSSRQTFAQYTGRPVSRDPFFPERAISSGEDTGGLDSSRPKLIQPESGNDFVVVPSGGAKKTVTIVEHHSSSSAAGEESWVGVVSSPVPLHVLPSVQSSQAKPGILQHPSMLSLDSNGSGPASISDPPSEPSVAVPISSVPAGYGLPAKMTVEHLIKDEALSVPSAHHAPVQVHEQHRQIIHTPPPNAPQPILVTPSTFAGSGSGQSFDVAIQGRGILLPESPGKNQVHHSPGGPSAPSESRPLGPMDHSSNVQGLGKFVLEGSNITANESDVARTRRRMEDARRRGGAEVIDDELSVQSNEFKRLLEAEAKTEKAKRATAGYAGASPTKVEIFNQIFQATKDPKKLELIKIQLPEAAGKPVEHTFSDDKSASQQLHANPVTAQGSAAEPAREPADPHASWIELSASDIILPGKVPPGHAENSIGGALHATKVARAFKEAEINAIKSALSKALESDTYCYLISQLDKLFARCNSIASQNAPPAELPIYDNQGGILLTRTYRAQTPPTTFEEILSSSDNPLLCLHQQYCSYLSKTHRLRLLNAAVMEDRLKTDMPQSKSVHQLLGLLLESVLTLVKDCNEMLSLMDACEDRVGTMVELLRRKPDYLSVVAANPRMAELYG